MLALDRKLWRDLRRMAAQLAAIALVVVAGVASFTATMTTYRALRLSEERYYAGQRFAEVWSGLARAPLSVARDVRALPGVAAMDARIVARAILDVPGLLEPASALLISIPEASDHALNGLYIRSGRQIEAGRRGEVLVSEAFAEKNRLHPGDTISGVVAGHRVQLSIAGVALSPEYVMQIAPGTLSPDDRRFAVLWVSRAEIERLVDLPGAFNDVALTLGPGAHESAVIQDLDRLLEPYGGRGAYGRSSQASHVMLEDHIEQLKALAVVVPSIFLAVAAFLVNVVLGRVVATEREQIGMLKAFGYSNLRVAVHYLELAAIVVVSGALAGLPLGVWLGRLMAVFYARFFRFPVLLFRLELWVVSVALFVALGAACAGALGTLRRLVKLPPVVAMSAQMPVFSRPFPQRLGLRPALPPAWRMIFRNVSRRPFRALLTTAGMVFAIAILVLGSSSTDAIQRAEDVQFQAAQREDIAVQLSQRQPLGTLASFASLPGVRRAEPYRAVPARVELGAATQDVTLFGLPADGILRHATGTNYERASPVPSGAFVTAWLGRRFHLRRGEALEIEIREGRRRSISIRVAGFIDEPLGEAIYLELGGLNRLLAEPETYSGVNLLLDPAHERELYAVLKRTAVAATVSVRRGTLANYQAMTHAAVDFIRKVEVIFSVIIAFGVVYNSARIALSERSRELSTLRVLGFRRGEVSAVLLGEIAALAAPAIPLGLLAGHGLTAVVLSAMSSSRLHLPVLVETSTDAFAVLVFAAAAVVSALVVRRRLDALDLVAVLKARE